MASAVSPVSSSVINPALGLDLAGISGLTANMSEVAGRVCLGQGLARRLITPRGRLIYDPNYGTDLTDIIGEDVTVAQVMQLGPQIVTEFLKDERVKSAVVSLQFVGLNQIQQALAGIVANPNPYPEGAIIISVVVTDITGTSFPLTIGVTSVTSMLLQVGS